MTNERPLPLTDEALVARIAKGDHLAMQELFARYRAKIFQFVLRLVGDPSAAEEILGEVFVEVWNSASKFEPRLHVSTWLMAIARFRTLQHLRKRKPDSSSDEVALEERAPAEMEAPELISKAQILRKSLEELSAEHRQLIDLVYYQEKSIEEVAALLHIPENTVKTRMFYARRKLAELMRAAERAALPEQPPKFPSSSPGRQKGRRRIRSAGSTNPSLGGDGPQSTGDDPGDAVDVSVFAPVSAKPGRSMLVQVFLHAPEKAEEAEQQARRSDEEAVNRGATSLTVDLTRGQKVGIALDAGALHVDDPVQSLTWRGKTVFCSFLVDMLATPDKESYFLRARVDIGGTPVGSIRFRVKIEAVGLEANYAMQQQGEAKRYERAFLSHSHDDAAEVFKIAQAYQAAGISFFHDIFSLRAGVEWETRLFEEIDRCDLFLLFWTNNAAQSSWVRKETEYALARKEKSPDSLPDVVPILLTSERPKPPDWLKHIHMDHVFRLAMLGAEAERRSDFH